jgi:iron complex transport system permease protein
VRLLWGRIIATLCRFQSGRCHRLLIADVLARIVWPQELPIGIITALAGAPFFLWVLRQSQRAAARD